VKVVVCHQHRFELWRAPEWLTERLRSQFRDVQFFHLHSYDDLEAQIGDADVLIGWSIRPEQFAKAMRLRWIHSPAAAVHQLMYPELIASEVHITNAGSVHGPVVAEHAIAMVLALAKGLPAAMRYQQEHRWAQQSMWSGAEAQRPREVAGATLALIGLGSIGCEVARRARALGMRVIAVREHPERGAQTANEVVGRDQLHHVLAEAEYVVLAAPVTDATTAIINAETLRKMRSDAYLINVSRGALVDEAALLRALREGTIAGGALDVLAQEPLPPDSPLWEAPNLLITPHTAAVTAKLWERHFELIRENLRRFLDGEPLLSEVDKHRRY